jgi:hypothetical protein
MQRHWNTNEAVNDYWYLSLELDSSGPRNIVFTATGYKARRVGMKNAVYDFQFRVFKTCCAIFTNDNSRLIGFDFTEINEGNQPCNGWISFVK